MANAAIAYSNLADGATLTASTQEILAGISNLQQVDVGRTWRGVSGGDDYFVADLGALTSINCVGLFGIVADTIRARLSSTDDSGEAGDLHDTGTVSVDQSYLQYILALSSALSPRYVRIDLSRSGGSDVEAGRLFIGNSTSFAQNFSYGWQRARTDRSLKAKTDGGQTVSRKRTNPRTLDLTFDALSEAEANGLSETVERVNGATDDVLFMLDTASSNLARDSLWGQMTELMPISNPAFGFFSRQYKIEQRL